jgi:hypothetical protein
MNKNISIEMEYNIKYILLEILKQYEYTAKYYACNIKIEHHYSCTNTFIA